MFSLSGFLAKKIYSDSGETKKVSLPAVRIATIGMAIGLAVMIVSVSVVLGFKKSIQEKVIGFGSHVIVKNFNSVNNYEQIPIAINDSLMNILSKAPEVEHLQRYAYSQGILKTDSDFLGVMFKGIEEDYDTIFLRNNIVKGAVSVTTQEAGKNNILISKIIADKLHLDVGSKVYAYFLADGSVKTRRFFISGVYQTNLTKYDESFVFTDMRTVQKLNSWKEDQVSGAEIKLTNIKNLENTAQWLVKHVNKKQDPFGETFSSQTIYEINPQIFAWLDLLDLNVWMIFALMIIVATVTMISGLLIVILERIPMIGMLKALGARNSVIRNTFLWFGTMIAGRGIIYGNILGLAICIIQNTTGIISLDPQTYYVSTVQVDINIPIILLINIATILVSIAILTIPTILVSHISPTASMKFKE